MFSLSRLRTLGAFRSRGVRLGAAMCAAAAPLLSGVLPASADTLAAAPRPPVAPYVLAYSTVDGTPDMSAGEGMGYWLWSDTSGLHLRTTTHGLPHEFSGALHARGSAQFTNVTGVKLEDSRHNHDHEVQVDDDTIRFRFVTYNGIDGIDFTLDGDAFCVELDNNDHDALRVTHIGADEVRPVHMPVCFKR